MQIQVVSLNQDDPRKCTAGKLVRFGLAKNVKTTKQNNVVLNPFAPKFLIPTDKQTINSITAIDCSWKFAKKTFLKKFKGIHRKLPPLLTGNPVNYSQLGKLSTVEALAGAAIILGEETLAMKLLDKFKWGHTFYELNKNLFQDYARLETEDQIPLILSEYQISK